MHEQAVFKSCDLFQKNDTARILNIIAGIIYPARAAQRHILADLIQRMISSAGNRMNAKKSNTAAGEDI